MFAIRTCEKCGKKGNVWDIKCVEVQVLNGSNIEYWRWYEKTVIGWRCQACLDTLNREMKTFLEKF